MMAFASDVTAAEAKLSRCHAGCGGGVGVGNEWTHTAAIVTSASHTHTHTHTQNSTIGCAMAVEFHLLESEDGHGPKHS